MGRALLPLGFVVLAFGAGCLNYTTGHGVEHHRAVAAKHGLPPPSRGIYFAGLASTAVGAGAVGFALGRGRAARAAARGFVSK